MWFQFIVRASIESAFWSGIGDTYSGSLWFRRVANRSKLGNWVIRKTAFATDWLIPHSVEIGLVILLNRSARTLNFPGMCFIRRFIWFWWHHIRVFQTSMQRSGECVPPDSSNMLLLFCLLIWEPWSSLWIEEPSTVSMKWPSFLKYWCGVGIGFWTRLHDTEVLPAPDVNPSLLDWHARKCDEMEDLPSWEHLEGRADVVFTN